MKEHKPADRSKRIIELLVDYVLVVFYLFILFLVFLFIYIFILDQNMPNYTNYQIHLLSVLKTTVPITLFFSYLDYKAPYGTVGKRFIRLKVHYKKYSFTSSLLRNIMKFLPWQIAHIGVIEGVYTNFESTFAILMILFSILLAGIMVWMGLYSKGRRHLGDFIAGTRVVEA